MRARLSTARSSGTCSPSANPFAAATDQLPVASARAPAEATAFAVPASQILNSTSGRPDTCSDRNVSALAACADIVLFTLALRAALLCCDMSMPPPEERTGLGELVRLFQFCGAVLAAHLDRFAADLDLNWVVAEFAVASSAGRLCHDAHLHERP